jgi:Holliday junction DNA helicase RuvB
VPISTEAGGPHVRTQDWEARQAHCSAEGAPDGHEARAPHSAGASAEAMTMLTDYASMSMPELERARAALTRPSAARKPKLQPLDFAERSSCEFRPSSFRELVGQDRLKALLARICANADESGRPLDHMLLLGSSGLGKTTLARVIAQEIGRPVYQLKAPIEIATLKELARVAADGEIVIVDEIHEQAKGEPEVLYHALEDRVIVAKRGAQPFPAVTFIGCTTDAGRLPEAFLGRFPLALQLDPYTDADMLKIVKLNARKLGVPISPEGARVFSWAARSNPRVAGGYVKNARALAAGEITQELAVEVVELVCQTSLDGLTRAQQRVLVALLDAERVTAKGETIYKASVASLATACEIDVASVVKHVEPYLIRRGLVTIAPGGRALTAAGVERAEDL